MIPWLLFQGIAGFTGFYLVTDTIPPRFALLFPPALFFIAILFISKAGKSFIDSLSPKTLTYLHTVRIPVEFVLWWLFLNGQVPELITFEGRNFDILAGITAPFVGFFGYTKTKLNRLILITWNIVCLGLLINIVSHAFLSAPTPFQQFAFDQPTVGVLYFPFIWLPAGIVPIVLFSHLVCLRFLMKKK